MISSKTIPLNITSLQELCPRIHTKKLTHTNIRRFCKQYPLIVDDFEGAESVNVSMPETDFHRQAIGGGPEILGIPFDTPCKRVIFFFFFDQLSDC